MNSYAEYVIKYIKREISKHCLIKRIAAAFIFQQVCENVFNTFLTVLKLL